jgi:hypothetical protein
MLYGFILVINTWKLITHDWNFLPFCGSLLQRPQVPCTPDLRTHTPLPSTKKKKSRQWEKEKGKIQIIELMSLLVVGVEVHPEWEKEEG